MRSSVSYILSSSTVEPNMSHPDYEQYSHDHAAILVLVRTIGTQLKPKVFNRLLDRIIRVTNVKITDSTGQARTIRVRYLKEHPLENNDWGDFQTHRRLLGFISIAKYDTQVELNEICRVHESFKVKYTSTLFDSRCILFGMTPEPPVPEVENKLTLETNAAQFTTPTNFKAHVLYFTESEICADLESQISEFVNSLFWVLESKRLERSREKLERVSLLLAPFEKKDFVGLDMESRNNKKRCTGRMTKHLGDLCLQAGLISESLLYYMNASETLKSINDWLWLGAAYEGLCAASSLVLYPQMQRDIPLQRNASLQEGSPKRANSITATIDEAFVPPKDIAHLLTPDDISKRYRDAIIHYSKYQNAGIIETEASFKAARISVEQNHSLQAASFLQNVVFISLNLSEQEKIQRFETLSDLYKQIGFFRKASFCERMAATRYVSPQNQTPNWMQCYTLMLQCFPGHKLSLDPYEMCTVNGQIGWPALQIQLLQELIVAAKRMGHPALATRHSTFLLQTMWDSLSSNDRKEFAIQLQTLASQCEGAPVSLVLDSGIVIPPANLTNLPLCTMFQVKNLQPHMQPQKIEKIKTNNGPFIYTPVHFGAYERDSGQPKTKMDFLWVENDLCEVTVKLVNPLPFELRVSNMRLLTSGPVFESIPETLVLPSETPTVLTLNGVPKESGELEIFGYSTHTLGIKSNCRLRYMKQFRVPRFLPQYNIDVIPALPTMDVRTSLPQSATFSSFTNFENVVTSASISLYNGESAECTITLTNTSAVPVEFVDVSIETVLDAVLQNQIFKWSQTNLQSQLPLEPNATASLTLYLYSAANFLATSGQQDVCGSSRTTGSSIMSMSAGPSSLPSQLQSTGSFQSRRNDISASFRSSNSGQSSLMSSSCRSPGSGFGSGIGPSALTLPRHSASSIVEGQLQLRYSGGPGFKSGYCRVCSVYIILEMIPSLQITNWDVLPAETNSQFYLVLDVANLTSQEMDLQYTDNKNMLIEGLESCRIPIPVNRCPLSKLTKFYMEQSTTGVDECLQLDKICSEHVANLVDIKWHLLSTDVRGKATLKGITLTPDMLDLVRISPLQWDVSINDELAKPQNGVNCEIGECTPIRISVRNILERPLRQLTMTVQFYQDHQNGVCNYRLETKLAIAGMTKIFLDSLEPEAIAHYECNVVFFTPGQYKLDIRCSAPECLYNEFPVPVSTVVGNGHVWRFIPPVELSVKE